MKPLAAVAVAFALLASARAGDARLRVALFDFEGGAGVADEVGRALAADPRFLLLDRGLVAAAARGAGASGSLNMTREEARSLGAVAGADVVVLGLVSVVDRQPLEGPMVGDAFVGLFLVDGRSGELVRYRGVSATARDRATALAGALAAVRAEVVGWGALADAAARRRERAVEPEPAPGVDFTAAEPPAGATPPRFFRRPSPAMTSDGERALVSATVDLVVDFGADGTYGPIQVVRWAGFGLDEAAAEAVRSSKFWPAMRGGKPVASRGLLRFNFRVKTVGAGSGASL